MNIVLLSCLSASALLLWLLQKKSYTIYLKVTLLPIIAAIFIGCLIAFPKASVASALTGIRLWLDIVFPSLFPFFVASYILSKSGFIRVVGVLLDPVMRPIFNVPGTGSLALAMGITSGYPVGASITADLYKDGMVSKIEAERLLTFTNNSGPLFIMGAVGVGMYGLPTIGYLLYGCHIIACLTVGVVFGFFKRIKGGKIRNQKISTLTRLKKEMRYLASSKISAATLFGDAIKNSVLTILNIGGFIIFFSVVINILIKSGVTGKLSSLLSHLTGCSAKLAEGALCGLLEITSGTNIITSDNISEMIIKLCLTSLVIGWAGFSVHTQVMSIISQTDISVVPYLAGKMLQGVLAAIYTYVGCLIFKEKLLTAMNVCTINPNSTPAIFSPPPQNFLYSVLGISAIIAICMGFIYISKVMSKMKLL